MKRITLSLLTLLVAGASAEVVCRCGVAPERENDFFWENGKFGMRAYGPGNYHIWSGLDLFNKMPDAASTCGYVLHNPSKCGHWHEEPYQGVIDNYTMGASRGLGGVALFGDGEWKTYPTWETCEIVTNSSDLCEFRLIYPAFSALGRMTYHITLRRGERFFRNRVSFEFPKRTRDFRFGPGLDTDPKRGHGGDLREDAVLGVISLCENTRSETDGSTMTAIFIDPNESHEIRIMTDHLNCRVLTVRKPSFTYWAGAAWSKAGEIITAEQWHREVLAFRRSVASSAL